MPQTNHKGGNRKWNIFFINYWVSVFYSTANREDLQTAFRKYFSDLCIFPINLRAISLQIYSPIQSKVS